MIEIFDISFIDRFNDPVTGRAPNLRASIGGYMQARIKFYAHWEIVSKKFIFNGKQIQSPDVSWLDSGFAVGDEILINGTQNNDNPSTVIKIVSLDKVFMLTDSASDFTNETATCSVYGTSVLNAVRFNYGLVENGKTDSFLSRLDNLAVQEYLVQDSPFTPATPYPLTPLYGVKHWITGPVAEQNPTVTRLASSSGIGFGKDSYYQIDHVFYVDPVTLADWLDGNNKLVKSLNELFANGKSPRYCYKIQAATDNQNYRLSTVGSNIKSYELNGAVAWFGEQGNGLPTLFTIDSIAFNEDSSGDAVMGLLGNSITNVHIVCKCTAPSAFTNTNKQFVDTYIYEKVAKSVYTNGVNDLFTNFNVGYATGNAAGTGTTVFNTISAYVITWISATEIHIDFKYTGTGSTNGYALWIETQSGAIADLKATDKTALLVGEGTITPFFNLEDVVSDQVRFVEHPFVDYVDGTTDYKGWVEDGVLAIGSMRISKLNNTGQSTALNSVVVNIVAENLDGRSFILETMPLAIGSATTRDFKLPVGDPKLEVSLMEIPSLETPSDKYYILKYAFKIRFEKWLAQNNVDADFIGIDNKDWSNYTDFKNWNLKFQVDHIIDIAAGQDIVRVESNLFAKTYDSFDICIAAGDVQTFEEISGAETFGLLSRKENTRILATFTGDGLDCYSFVDTDFYGILELYIFQQGTIADIRQISTLYDPEPDTPWKGLAGNKALLTKTAGPNMITVEAVILLSKLDQKNNYTVSGRAGKSVPQPPETCTCPTGYTYDPTTLDCKQDADPDIHFPCGCVCPDGYAFDSTNNQCIKYVPAGTNLSGNRWDFGNGAALDHNNLNANGDPTFTLDGQLVTQEGCTGFADVIGDRLFYTDGRKIFNGVNTLKASDLKGNASSTQSALAIQNPIDLTEYYVFVIDADGAPFTGGGGGSGFNLTYNILTAVTHSDLTIGLKNERLYPIPIGSFPDGTTVVSEKMAATSDNTGGYWLIVKTHVVGPTGTKPNFVVFNINGATGELNTTPINIIEADSYGASANIGQSKFSSNNTRFSSVNFENSVKIDLYNFDSATGLIDKASYISLDIDGPAYGVEFSPDGTKLYITQYRNPFIGSTPVGLYQFDLEAGNQAAIQASRVNISTGGILQLESTLCGQLQLASNGRIYMAHAMNQAGSAPSGTAPNFIGVIANPNKHFVRTIGDITNGNASIINIPSAQVAKMEATMLILGIGIPAGATILSIDSPTSITISINATATNAGTAITVNGCDYHCNSVDPLSVPLNGNPLGYYANALLAHLSTLGLPTFLVSIFSNKSILPCISNSGTSAVCSLPAVAITTKCVGLTMQIMMVTNKGATWIVTDDQGTPPFNIIANGTYTYGSYSNGETVAITLTNSTKPECFLTESKTFTC